MEDALLKYLKYYEKLPGWIKRPIGMLYASLPTKLRHGEFYKQYCKRIKDFTDHTAPETLQQKLDQMLFNQVNMAIEQVPFYRNYPKVKSLENFQKLPIVSKSDYLQARDQFCTADPARRLQVNTGGSSGTPLTFFVEKNVTRPKEKAHFDWFWGHWGYTPRSRILMLRGKPLANNALFEYQSIKNCLNISCYELTLENAPQVLREIKKFRPDFIHGYPSAVKVFTRCAGSEGQKYFSNLKALFLGSEFLSDTDRMMFEEYFSAPCCAWYGHTECALHGGTLPGHGSDLVFFPFYGYLELVDDNGNILTTPGSTGRIVATGFDNSAMPFIRYDTGDLGTWGGMTTVNNCPCPVLTKIEGRAQDVIYLSDGSEISLTAFIFGQHLKEFDRIREMQLEQSQPGKLTLRLVPLQELSEADRHNIADFLDKSVSGRLQTTVEITSHIEKTWRGKHRFLIQHCK